MTGGEIIASMLLTAIGCALLRFVIIPELVGMAATRRKTNGAGFRAGRAAAQRTGDDFALHHKPVDNL